jgi:hypothetical protein
MSSHKGLICSVPKVMENLIIEIERELTQAVTRVRERFRDWLRDCVRDMFCGEGRCVRRCRIFWLRDLYGGFFLLHFQWFFGKFIINSGVRGVC